MKRALRIGLILIVIIIVLFIAVVVYVLLRWDRPDGRQAPVMAASRDSVTIAHGEHLFKDTWQCWGCHTSPPADGNTIPSGGLAFDLRKTGPGFGTYYGSNITPDSTTGIGGWTDGEVVQAIREGVGKDRRAFFPVMPFEWLYGMSDSDALAIVAYLRSIPPVTNAVPANEPSFIAKALMTFGMIQPKPAITTSINAPPPGPTAAYGRYFANHAAGCAECHTPRNLRNGAFYMDSLFAGSSFAYGEDVPSVVHAYARNISPDNATGIGQWGIDDFIAAVTTGVRPDSTVLTFLMPYSHYKFLTADELRAMYLYLKSLRPIERTTPPPTYTSSYDSARGMARGKMLFGLRCQTCHGVDGLGARPTNVKLEEVASLMSDSDLRETIAGGQRDVKMPGFRKTLTAAELNDLVAYIRSWK